MRNFVTLAALLSLAACGDGGRQPPANDTIAVPDNAAVTLPAPPETPEPAPSPSPSPSPSAAPDSGSGIPVALHGRWGLVPADCTSTRGDNKGLLTIDGTTLRFYESVGTLGKVAERDANRIVADFAMTGEGREWTRRMTLDAADGGKTLVRREQGADAMPDPLRYQKCA
ncbi:hypothetical protein Q9Q95_08915 [Sphingomonas sp. DG1-23]|uniref:hypothetical protein n=1 Tax=Sphingomonas sp. DG1-23 TaxID=3068316 RepID=UPI00273DFCEE|nr:hypothetical protein [Sphingomonas sp. DG1-23]MDP5279043.1 hypothetical protein [Sphingomonas sp. DG1-23]